MSSSNLTLDSADRVIPVLARDGYALIRDVLSAEEVARARAVCDAHLLPDADAECEIEATELLRMPELGFIFDERVVAALSGWLGGTLAYYPNYVARLNRFTEWHVDNGFSPRFIPDASHLYSPDFRHLQCIVYLQDNVPGAGGGLDVRPGSHGWAAGGPFPDDDELARSYPDIVSVDSRAGDLIVFDGRLMHRGTPTDGSLKRRKYGIFWSASRDDQVQIDRYLAYFLARVDHLRTLNQPPDEFEREELRFQLMRSIRFPASYLPQEVEVLRKFGVTLAELPGLTPGSA
ncbi:phytanoyl-CoA dioxygenase family protein [Kitasatospora sp. LaBMicrA B282]|uniref:phytanoyl-CoA dioxygenase family protein n=1 Tax=Kitasatospora sp. LaBMicrA B282 TaxID=3420949 RepID=UPI003D0C5265